jgi:type I restriction enzyme S subunit
MKYQTYPVYKDSGVEWLGDVPEHWDARQLKFLCTCNDEVLSDSVNPDYEIEYVDIGSVSAVEGVTKTENMTFANSPSRARRIVRDGDVIISTVRTYLEAIAPVDNPPENLIVSTGFAVIRPNQFLQKGYAAYCLRANGFIKEVVARSVGISYPAINASDLVNIKTPEPSFPEQQKIAQFLDHETAKIDTLIEKQQRLIELLKEKRQAVISHAVTKGLNPNAPMKDSGVEWLGEVPEHWNYGRLIYMCERLVDGTHHSPESHFQGDYLYITAKNIKENGFDFSEITYITKEDHKQIFSRCSVQKDDVLYIKDGATAGIAMVNYLNDEFSLLSSVALIRPMKSKIISRFLAYHLNASQFKNNVLNQLVGGAMTRFTLDMISRFILSLPPIDEQNQIVDFLNNETVKFDNLIEKSNSAIELMQERRTALISAAVTGKIDVRNWNAPNA